MPDQINREPHQKHTSTHNVIKDKTIKKRTKATTTEGRTTEGRTKVSRRER